MPSKSYRGVALPESFTARRLEAVAEQIKRREKFLCLAWEFVLCMEDEEDAEDRTTQRDMSFFLKDLDISCSGAGFDTTLCPAWLRISDDASPRARRLFLLSELIEVLHAQ